MTDRPSPTDPSRSRPAGTYDGAVPEYEGITPGKGVSPREFRARIRYLRLWQIFGIIAIVTALVLIYVFAW